MSSALIGAALGGLVALLFVAIGSRPAGISDQDLVVIAIVVPIATVVYGLVAFFVGRGTCSWGASSTCCIRGSTRPPCS